MAVEEAADECAGDTSPCVVLAKKGAPVNTVGIVVLDQSRRRKKLKRVEEFDTTTMAMLVTMEVELVYLASMKRKNAWSD